MRAKVSSIYALERLIEPEAFGYYENNDETKNHWHRNKWSKYAKGKNTPRKYLVEKTEALLPGSQREIEHPLWNALSPNQCFKKHSLANLVNTLSPEILLALNKRGLRTTTGYLSGKRTCGIFLRFLERTADLDALACATIFLRHALVNQDAEQANKLERTVVTIHLSLGAHFKDRGLSSEMFNLYVKRYLSNISYGEARFDYENYDFEASVMLLEKLMEVLNGRSKGEWPARKKFVTKTKILGGNYDLQWIFELYPNIVEVSRLVSR